MAGTRSAEMMVVVPDCLRENMNSLNRYLSGLRFYVALICRGPRGAIQCRIAPMAPIAACPLLS